MCPLRNKIPLVGFALLYLNKYCNYFLFLFKKNYLKNEDIYAERTQIYKKTNVNKIRFFRFIAKKSESEAMSLRFASLFRSRCSLRFAFAFCSEKNFAFASLSQSVFGQNWTPCSDSIGFFLSWKI